MSASHSDSLNLDANPKENPKRRTVSVVGGIDGVDDDRVIANGKDLSHTMRGEYMLERSGDVSQLNKKRLVTSGIVSPRRKKPASKQETPKWQTIISVLTKNCLLIAFLMWAGQTIWKWTDRIQVNSISPFASLDFEGRVSEVEASLKKTARMLQIQLDVLDKKIGSGVGDATRESMEQLEEKSALFEKKVKRLEDRTNDLDKSLSELKDMGLISKGEFESFWNELKDTKSLDGSGNGVNLDHVRVLARDIVEKEIEKHAADGLGKVDYALASGGAKVILHSEPYDNGKSDRWFAAARGRHGVHGNAHKMLEPSFGQPGQCFALEGSEGYVTIKLRTAIIPDAVTLEHVSKSASFDRSSAPKDCLVWGWHDERSSDAPKLMSSFSYDLEKSSVQTFSVMGGVGVINNVRLEIKSNHGSSAVTCIYRLRVHGYEPSSPVSSDIQS